MDREPCPLCKRPNFHPNEHHLVPASKGGKTTETVCRDCHRAIHATIENRRLEKDYNTVEALLAHPGLAKTIAFIAKQDPGGRTKTARPKTRERKH
jgi:5-methylcytosine-specific restriction endonuclease McrA